MQSVENLLITQLINAINDNIADIGLPCGVTLGVQTVSGKAIWIQALGGMKKTKIYLRGRYSGEFPFAVYYRLSGAEMGGIEAKMFVPHEQLAEWFDKNNWRLSLDNYIVQDIAMTAQPTIYSKGEDGTTVYQSRFNFQFTKER